VGSELHALLDDNAVASRLRSHSAAARNRDTTVRATDKDRVDHYFAGDVGATPWPGPAAWRPSPARTGSGGRGSTAPPPAPRSEPVPAQLSAASSWVAAGEDVERAFDAIYGPQESARARLSGCDSEVEIIYSSTFDDEEYPQRKSAKKNKLKAEGSVSIKNERALRISVKGEILNSTNDINTAATINNHYTVSDSETESDAELGSEDDMSESEEEQKETTVYFHGDRGFENNSF